MAASMDMLTPHLSKINTPGGQKVYKDECAYSCDTPECETGLYICMNTFIGFGKKHVERHYRKTGNAVYLHLQRIRKEMPVLPPGAEDPPKKKPTKLAIGVEGGFDTDEKKFQTEEKSQIVVLPSWTEISLADPGFPQQVQMSAIAILLAESAAKQEEAAAWQGEARQKSQFTEGLVQHDSGRRIPPTGWKCEQCDKTDNLWLNLTDGSILCGRRFFDGSGGNNHAVEQYEKTKYPLAVKLGTITPDGADVYSYAEDDMVEDPLLGKHLAHWGIDIMQMEKTDKTMTELEIDINQRVGEWDVIQEAGSALQPVYGPAYTGLRNLGNSCYMNSVMQVIFTVPDFVNRYYTSAEEIFTRAPLDPTSDFNVQMAKLASGLLSGDYSHPPPDVPADNKEPIIRYQDCVRPQMFRTLVGRGHQEFSTKRQQDAQEYLLHLFTLIERNSRSCADPCDSVRFSLQDRLQCTASRKVRYSTRTDYLLQLPVPLEAATNKEEVAAYEQKKKELEKEKKVIDVKEMVRPRVSLTACLESFAAQEIIEDFFSPAVNATGTATRQTCISTFPDYLLIQLKKFTISDDWVPKKLDVSVEMPDDLDLSYLRAQGRQAGEEELPEGKSGSSAAQEVQIDEALVNQVAEMGFPREACRKAVYHTRNAGLEPAMNWVMEHMDDPDFASPLQLPGSSDAAQQPDPESLMMIVSMGFTPEQAAKALKATNNNVERAADWIFSHMGELDAMEVEPSGGGAQQGPQCRDGSGKYRLCAFISHMGTSPHVGHYVCHIKRDGRWVIYNDEKVALSKQPPKDLGYLYLYARV